MNAVRRGEEQAVTFLRKHGVARPPVDVKALAAAEGATIEYEDLGPSTSGLVMRREDDCVAIGVNSQHHTNRQRFTIAHEIGHLLMHAKTPTVIVDHFMVHFRDDNGTPGSDIREMEANAFAAALLMPREWLRADLHDRPIDCNDEAALRSLATRYQVSPQSLAFRLGNVGLTGGVAPSASKRSRRGRS